MTLPPDFIAYMQQRLGAEWPAFVAALADVPPVSIRYNQHKLSPSATGTEPVPWLAEGHYLPKRPVFTLDPAFHAGAYYVQEASSMFVAAVLEQCIDTTLPLNVLDLCAAPGGKSTLLADVLSADSLLLANEVIRPRYQTLRYNLAKWGLPNTHTSNHDSRDFAPLAGFFDVIIVDAPCSGEGLFRKDDKAAHEWSPDNVQLCAGRQKRILAEAVPLLKPGGVLLYCTCTYNDHENRDNVEWLTAQFLLAPIALRAAPSTGILVEGNTCQFLPHRTRGEGFFIAAFRKTEGEARASLKTKPFERLSPVPKALLSVLDTWVDNPAGDLSFYQDKNGQISAVLQTQAEHCAVISQALYRFEPGFRVGTFKGKDFIPAPELALHTRCHPATTSIGADKAQALRFLKKEDPALGDVPKGWVKVTYQGLGLGWVKGLPNRINNYYPREWRILMNLPEEAEATAQDATVD